MITDGPYSETEKPAGYWVLECEGLERVTEIAEHARCPQPARRPRLPGRDDGSGDI
ncbi:hypothetical protein [Streptomyces sp. DG1A-41]|uniref:hypothetical protein n=1 Tax=Streptomyces sp. DG1A-41 TaxID=3125779 RepID=UPI0030D114A6